MCLAGHIAASEVIASREVIVPLLDAADVQVTVEYHMVSIQDADFDQTQEIELTSWFNAGSAKVIVVTDEDALNGHVRLESWDGEAAFDPDAWHRSAVADLMMPSGQVGTEQIAFESMPLDFSLPRAGRYRIRVAVCEHPAPPASPGTPEWEWPAPSVTVLAQFWPA